MTDKQLKNYTVQELLIIYKGKAICSRSENISRKVYKELEERLGYDYLFNIRLAKFHFDSGEGMAELIMECNNLIEKEIYGFNKSIHKLLTN